MKIYILYNHSLCAKTKVCPDFRQVTFRTFSPTTTYVCVLYPARKLHLSVGTAWTVPLTCRVHVQMSLPLVGPAPQGNPPGLASTAAPNLLTAAVHVFPKQIWQVGNSYVRSQRFLECVRLAVDAVSALSLRVFGCIPVGVQSSLPCHWMRFALAFVSVLAFPCLLSCLLVGFFYCLCLPSTCSPRDAASEFSQACFGVGPLLSPSLPLPCPPCGLSPLVSFLVFLLLLWEEPCFTVFMGCFFGWFFVCFFPAWLCGFCDFCGCVAFVALPCFT
jgi:hypothetical protein